MKLIVVEATFDPQDREGAIALFQGQADAVRGMEGCDSYGIFASPAHAGDIVIVQRWASLEAFDAYKASDVFARLGQGLRPLMSAPPATTIADVSDGY